MDLPLESPQSSEKISVSAHLPLECCESDSHSLAIDSHSHPSTRAVRQGEKLTFLSLPLELQYEIYHHIPDKDFLAVRQVFPDADLYIGDYELWKEIIVWDVDLFKEKWQDYWDLFEDIYDGRNVFSLVWDGCSLDVLKYIYGFMDVIRQNSWQSKYKYNYYFREGTESRYCEYADSTSPYLTQAAVVSGNLECIEWLWHQPIDFQMFSQQIIVDAAAVKLLKKLLQEGREHKIVPEPHAYRLDNADNPFKTVSDFRRLNAVSIDETSYAPLVLNGELEADEKVSTQNMDYLKQLYDMDLLDVQGTLYRAFEEGNIKVVKYLHQLGHRYNGDWPYYMIANRISNIKEYYYHFTEFYDFLHENNYKIEKVSGWCTFHSCMEPIINDFNRGKRHDPNKIIEIWEYYYNHGYDWEHTSDNAITFVEIADMKADWKVKVQLFDWLIKKEYPKEGIFEYVEPNIQVYQWLLLNEFPYNEKVFYSAIKSNSIEICQWLIENKFPYNESVIIQALKNCDIEICKFLLDNDFPYEDDGSAYNECLEASLIFYDEKEFLDEIIVDDDRIGKTIEKLDLLVEYGFYIDIDDDHSRDRFSIELNLDNRMKEWLDRHNLEYGLCQVIFWKTVYQTVTMISYRNLLKYQIENCAYHEETRKKYERISYIIEKSLELIEEQLTYTDSETAREIADDIFNNVKVYNYYKAKDIVNSMYRFNCHRLIQLFENAKLMPIYFHDLGSDIIGKIMSYLNDQDRHSAQLALKN